jgi:hypothetical protein
LLSGSCRDWRLGFRGGLSLSCVNLSCRNWFGDGSIFEEVIAEGSFEISYEFTDDLVMRNAESSGRGIANRLEFRLRRRFCVSSVG